MAIITSIFFGRNYLQFPVSLAGHPGKKIIPCGYLHRFSESDSLCSLRVPRIRGEKTTKDPSAIAICGSRPASAAYTDLVHSINLHLLLYKSHYFRGYMDFFLLSQ